MEPNEEQGRIVLLDRQVASELLDLVLDKPGKADEDLLDDALDALKQSDGSLDGQAQQRIAKGRAVAMELEDVDAEALDALIREDREAHPKRLRSVARTLKSKLSTARKKARRRR